MGGESAHGSRKARRQGAVITGSGVESGRAIALKFASEGAKIVVNAPRCRAPRDYAQIQSWAQRAIACRHVTAAGLWRAGRAERDRGVQGLDIMSIICRLYLDNVIKK